MQGTSGGSCRRQRLSPARASHSAPYPACPVLATLPARSSRSQNGCLSQQGLLCSHPVPCARSRCATYRDVLLWCLMQFLDSPCCLSHLCPRELAASRTRTSQLSEASLALPPEASRRPLQIENPLLLSLYHPRRKIWLPMSIVIALPVSTRRLLTHAVGASLALLQSS